VVSKRSSDAADVVPLPIDTGAPRAFDDVYAAEFDFVWRCLRSLGVRADVLDDAVQDVFVIVHRQLAGFRGDSGLRTWLFGITRNVAFNYRRGAERKQAPLVPLAEEPPADGPGPLESAQDAEAGAFVQEFMSRLDEDRRALFALAVLEELPIPEVAEALAIPLNTAYTRLRRLRAAFEAAIEARRETV
jgi:RNA polymerase sigma-70 factor (ECF subfamily)